MPGYARLLTLAALTLFPPWTAQASGPEVDASVERATDRPWGAALGFVVSSGPEYAGSARRVTTVEPGLALRWGRVSLASRSAFAVRKSDSGAAAGVRVELSSSDRFNAGLSLRFDGGRRESSSQTLQGLGDVPQTLRARLSASWRLENRWRVGSALLVDALGRGTGTVLDLRIGRDMRLSDSTSMAYSLALSAGDHSFLRTNFGVTTEQAQRSGYRVYEPGAGLLDAKLSLSARTELTPHWAAFYGANASRLLGAAARSPLAFERDGLSLSAGLVYRF